MWPHFGHVENVPPVLLCLLGLHDLDIDIPDRIISLFDGFEQVLNQKVRVFASDFSGLLFR